jgi:hypothetical protein
MDKTLVNLMKDYDNYTYDTPRPYNNRAEYGGESKYNKTVDQIIRPNINGTVILKNKTKYGGEILDKNKKVEVNITRNYCWKSRDY